MERGRGNSNGVVLRVVRNFYSIIYLDVIVGEGLGNDYDDDLFLGMVILRCLLDILIFVYKCLF